MRIRFRKSTIVPLAVPESAAAIARHRGRRTARVLSQARPALRVGA